MLIIIGNERCTHNLIFLPLDFLMTSIFSSYPLPHRWDNKAGINTFSIVDASVT